MRKLYIVGLVIAVALTFGIVYADQMTFSTYYPAPFGVYNQMVTRTLGVGDMNNDASINYLDAPDPNNSAQENDLWVAGSVGIGTTMPQTPLHIKGDAADLSIDMNSAGPYQNVELKFNLDGIPQSVLYHDKTNNNFVMKNDQQNTGNGDIIFRKYNQNQMVVKNNGNVGIGTTEPEDSKGSGGYVDAQDVWLRDADGGNGAWASAGGGGFGNYGSVTTISTTVPTTQTNEFTVTQAPTDLLLVATCAAHSDSWVVVAFKGYTGTTPNPTIYRGGMSITNDWGQSIKASADSFMMFVKKDEYYVVKGWAHMDAGTTRTYCTIPLGN